MATEINAHQFLVTCLYSKEFESVNKLI